MTTREISHEGSPLYSYTWTVPAEADVWEAKQAAKAGFLPDGYTVADVSDPPTETQPEANDVVVVGGEENLFIEKSGSTLLFKSIEAGPGTFIEDTGATLKLYSTVVSTATANAYNSPSFTMAAGGTIVWNHFLGKVPDFVKITLVCTEDTVGYVVGDRLVVNISTDSWAQAVQLDQTNVTFLISNQGSYNFRIPDKNTHSSTLAVYTAWKISFTAGIVK